MELQGTNFVTWLLEKHAASQPQYATQEVVDRFFAADRIHITSPEMAVRMTVSKLSHEWSAFRKRMLFRKVESSVLFCMANSHKDDLHSDWTEDDEEIDQFFHEAAEEYAKWVVNHPGIKEFWTQINSQYPERRTAIQEIHRAVR